MGGATVLVDPTSLALQRNFEQRPTHPDNDDWTPPLGQGLILLGKWFECAPKYRLRSILNKLCEEQAIAREVLPVLTLRDEGIAERAIVEECPD